MGTRALDDRGLATRLYERHTRTVVGYVVGVVVLTLATTAAAAIAKSSSVAGVSPWWPPAGIGFAYLAIVGARGFVAVFVARYVSLWWVFDWSESFLPRATVGRSVAIVAVYTVVAVGYRRLVQRRDQRARLFIFLGLGVVAGPVLAGVAGEIVQQGLSPDESRSIASAVRTFWVGDAVAIASISPFLILVASQIIGIQSRWRNQLSKITTRELVEVAAATLAPAVIILVGSGTRVEPRLTLALLPILWIALRHRPATALAGLLVVNTTSAYVLARSSASSSELVALQSILLASAVAALIIGAEVRLRADQLDRLSASAARYRRLVDGSPDLVVGLQDGGEMVLASPEVKFPHQDEVIEQISAAWGSLSNEVRRPANLEREWTLKKSSGQRWYRTRYVEDPDKSLPILSITTDLTNVRLAEQDLAQARVLDNLTGLPERGELARVLQQSLANLETGEGCIAVVHAGVDRFSSINRLHGPAQGDKILRLIVERLSNIVPPNCQLARLRGDEFAIAGFFPSGAVAAEAVAEAVVQAGRLPLDGGGVAATLTMSAGVATATNLDTDPEELLQSAETATAAAKEAGRDRVVVSHPQLISDAASRNEVLVGLREAIGTNQLILHYQPEVDLVTGRIVGYEALLRWNHPTRGLLMATEFIDLAEQSRLIDEMTYQLIEAAIEQVAELTAIGGDDLFVGINLTPTQLEDERLIDFVAAACRDHKIRPGRLRIEVTETTMMSEFGRAPEVLRGLRDLGSSIAIDDFGTGYASIGYLHRLPVDVVKIDRQFIVGLATVPTDRALVQMILGLAEGLDLTIVAEGIETDEQRADLIGLGCTQGQGFGLWRPASGAQVLADYYSHHSAL